MLRIDGSTLEGGGQIVRSSIALSALTGVPVEIARIRENRKHSGLGFQHCAAIRAVACTCGGRTEGNEPGSRRLSFVPGEIREAGCRVDVGTAGSIPLVIQAWLPVALAGGGTIEVTGGTEVPASPTIDYLEKVFFPALGEPGTGIRLEILARGYYPAGGGRVRVTVEPGISGGPVAIWEGGPCGLRSCSSGLPAHVAERQAARAGSLLRQRLGKEIPVELQRTGGPSLGSSCTAWCGAKGASSLGRPGFPAEKVGEGAATALIDELAAAGDVDSHLSDQLLIHLALRGGSYSSSTFTLHARTMCWLLTLFGFGIRVREGEGVEFSV